MDTEFKNYSFNRKGPALRQRAYKITKEQVAHLKWYLDQNATMVRRRELALYYKISVGYVNSIHYGNQCTAVVMKEPEEILFHD